MGKKARVYDGTAWQELASAQTDLTAYSTTAQTTAGFRNAIINGDFRINQRNFSSGTGTEFIADRWVGAPGDGTVTSSLQAFTAGAAPVAGYEGTNFARMVSSSQTAASAFSVLRQSIEDVRTFAGQTVTLSFWAKAGSGTPKLALEIQQNFGSGGSTAVNSYLTQVTLSTSWVRYSATVAIPSVSGKTIGTSSFLAVRIWSSAGTDFNSRTGSLGIQSGTFDFWGIQVEAGSVATPFEQRPIGTELALCQRYYYRISSFGGSRYGSGYAKTSTTADIIVDFPVTMRIAPTALEQSGTASDYLIAYQNSAVAGSSVPTFVGATPKAGVVNFNVGSVLTAGNGVMGGPNGANNYLGWSAEL